MSTEFFFKNVRFKCLDEQRYSIDALKRDRWRIPQSRADNIEWAIAEANELCPRHFQQTPPLGIRSFRQLDFSGSIPTTQQLLAKTSHSYFRHRL